MVIRGILSHYMLYFSELRLMYSLGPTPLVSDA